MKRIISLTLSLLLLLSVPAFADSYTDFAQSMGFLERTDSSEVTRGEFAEVLCKALNIELGSDSDAADEWYNGLFTEDNTDVLVDNSGFTQKFLDVPSSHKNYKAITKVAELGYMLGTGDSLFSPDTVILEQEAVKVLVSITGNSYYAESNGGYPYGYNFVAATNKMFEGCTYIAEAPLTADKLAVFVYNTLNMKLTVNTDSYGKVVFTVSDTTLLEKNHGVLCEKGRVTANEFTALDSMPEAGEDCVIINSVEYGIKDASYVRDFIGYDVVFYYRPEDMKILYAYKDKNCETEEFESNEIEKFEDYRLYYYTDEEKSDTDYIELAKDLNVIYNGSYQKEYTDALFKCDFGDVTVIKSQTESSYDTVIINSYEPYFITDIKEGIGIYASKVDEENAQLFDLSKVKINAYDENSKPVELENLKTSRIVDIAKGEKSAIIKSNSKVVENVIVSAIEFEDEVSFITPDGEYKAYDKWYKNTKLKPVAGKVYTIHLNSFGYVCRIESPLAQNTGEYNLYINSEYNTTKLSNKDIKIKAVNNMGVVTDYAIGEDVKIYAGNTAIKGKTNSQRYTNLLPYLKEHNVFLVSYNEEGKIKSLEFPVSDTERKNMLGMMSSGDSVAYLTSPAHMFENRTVVSDAKTIFRINTKATDIDKKYAVISLSALIDGNTYKMAAYNRNSDSVIAECAVVYEDATAESLGQYNTKLYIVEKIVTQRDEEGNGVSVLYGASVSINSNAMEQVVIESETGNELSVVKDFFGNTYTPKKGDVLMINVFNSKAVGAYLVYRDGLAGTSGLFETDKPNPFALSSSLTVQTTNMNKYRSGGARFFAGFAKDIESSKFLTYTNTIYGAEKNITDEKYLTETTVIPTNVVVVELKPFLVRKGTYADIKTYKNYGNECSKLLLHTDSGRVRHLIIFN